MSMRCFALLLLASTSMAAARQVRGMRGAAALSSAPAAAPAPGPTSDTPSMETTTVETEIENMNYYDMTKPWKDPLAENGTESGSGSNPNDWMMSQNDDAPKKKPTKDQKPAGTDGAAVEDPLGDMLGDAPTKPAGASGAGPETDGAVDDSPAGGNPETGGPVDDAPAEGNPEEKGPLDNVLKLGALPWPAKPSLLQVDARDLAKQMSALGAVTVQQVMRGAIEAAVKQTLACGGSDSSNYAPAPAPALLPAPPSSPRRPVPPSGVLPAAVALAAQPPWGQGPPPTAQIRPVAFAPASAPRQLRSPAPAPGASPAPAPGPACATPKVHVGLFPGTKMKRKHLRLLNAPPVHATVLVKVTLFERPGNGLDDMAGVKDQLQQALESGELKKRLADAIHGVTGVRPKLADIKVTIEVVKQWDIVKCGAHMSKLVKTFSLHYTKRQVPMALYNECTNFMTKMSFSHDYVLDPRDAARCRKATKKFALRWKLGESKDPTEFEPMCQRFCEAKFGDDAPQCQFAAE